MTFLTILIQLIQFHSGLEIRIAAVQARITISDGHLRHAARRCSLSLRPPDARDQKRRDKDADERGNETPDGGAVLQRPELAICLLRVS